jgi:hypothetical protein
MLAEHGVWSDVDRAMVYYRPLWLLAASFFLLSAKSTFAWL